MGSISYGNERQYYSTFPEIVVSQVFAKATWEPFFVSQSFYALAKDVFKETMCCVHTSEEFMER